MKIGPVSGDLLVKLAVGALAIGAVIYAVRKASSAGQDLANQILATARAAADKINPVSPNNLVYSGLTAATTALTGQANSPGTYWASMGSDGERQVSDMLNGTVTMPSTAIAPDQALGNGLGGFYSQPGALY